MQRIDPALSPRIRSPHRVAEQLRRALSRHRPLVPHWARSKDNLAVCKPFSAIGESCADGSASVPCSYCDPSARLRVAYPAPGQPCRQYQCRAGAFLQPRTTSGKRESGRSVRRSVPQCVRRWSRMSAASGRSSLVTSGRRPQATRTSTKLVATTNSNYSTDDRWLLKALILRAQHPVGTNDYFEASPNSPVRPASSERRTCGRYH